MTVPARLLALAALVGMAASVQARVIYEDAFETLNEAFWTKDLRGEGSIDIVEGGIDGSKCLRISSSGGHIYLVAKLDPAEHAGNTLTMSGMVKLENCELGPQSYSSPKFHFAQRVPGQQGVDNHAERWVGTFDWTEKRLSIEVKDNCEFLVMNIGNQNGTGVFYVDNFMLEDSLGVGKPISLVEVFNTGRSDGVADDGQGSFIDTGRLDLFHFDTAIGTGKVEVDGMPSFYPLVDGANGGRTLLALQGVRRPGLPATAGPVAVDLPVASLHLLGAAAWADVAGREPVLTMHVDYADGTSLAVVLRAGVDLSNFDDPQARENWQPVWTGPSAAGVTVGLGHTAWLNPRPETPIKQLRFESAGNGVPLLVACTYQPAARRR